FWLPRWGFGEHYRTVWLGTVAWHQTQGRCHSYAELLDERLRCNQSCRDEPACHGHLLRDHSDCRPVPSVYVGTRGRDTAHQAARRLGVVRHLWTPDVTEPSDRRGWILRYESQT